ncbi:MAG: hypothetical protein HGB06_10825 [Chlorobaculum sp.]|nr:hypothetical protein [Chlorobaculum sp.]
MKTPPFLIMPYPLPAPDEHSGNNISQKLKDAGSEKSALPSNGERPYQPSIKRRQSKKLISNFKTLSENNDGLNERRNCVFGVRDNLTPLKKYLCYDLDFVL